MPPRTFPQVKDYYAHARCVNCHPHLVYADDTEGGSCRFCECTDHRTPAAQTASSSGRSADDTDSTAAPPVTSHHLESAVDA